jgi:hypothetical protein
MSGWHDFVMKLIFQFALVSGLLIKVAWPICHGPDHIISAGIEDNFHGPPKPVTPSARLATHHAVRVYTELYGNTRFRRFDQDGGNLLFVTSLLLPSRTVCSAQFEMRVRRRSDGVFGYDYNDFLLLGFAPFSITGVRKGLFRAGVWFGDPYELLVKTVRLPLPAVEFNRFLLLTEGPHWFDIMVHNDTTVDYVKLILRFE